MSNVKELRSIDLASYTTLSTAISVVFSIIAAIIIAVGIYAFAPAGQSVIIYLIPTIIVGTFMYGIYNSFCQGLLYNLLSKKLRNIAVELNDGEILKISTTESAIMVSIILTIQVILLYLVSVFILPMMLGSIMQTLMMSGEEVIAYSIYQIIYVVSQPTTIAIIIFGTFIISFVFILISAYIYNFLASKGRGIKLNLTEDNNLTSIDSVDPLKFAIAIAIIEGVLNIITGVISVISGSGIINLVINIISGFVGGFIIALIIAVVYNFLSDKLGKIKVELIDFK